MVKPEVLGRGLKARRPDGGNTLMAAAYLQRHKMCICKKRGSLLRYTIYMCALNAKATNGACKDLFERRVAKGKTFRWLSGFALIAVANKLLKQVFGVVKNECLFDRNYYKKIA